MCLLQTSYCQSHQLVLQTSHSNIYWIYFRFKTSISQILVALTYIPFLSLPEDKIVKSGHIRLFDITYFDRLITNKIVKLNANIISVVETIKHLQVILFSIYLRKYWKFWKMLDSKNLQIWLKYTFYVSSFWEYTAKDVFLFENDR